MIIRRMPRKRLPDCFSRIEADLLVLKWMTAAALAGVLVLVANASL